jgi:hypothetical protein
MQSNRAIQPSYFGFVETRDDAIVLIQAGLQGSLHFVPRRATSSERAYVAQSGCVFIYEEKTSGIQRWTDGQHWSPSRVLGDFLIYGERSASPSQSHAMKRDNQPEPLEDGSEDSDVLLSIRYTSRSGGVQLKMAADAAVAAYCKSIDDLSQDQGLFALFDLQSDFGTEWARASAPSTPPPPPQNGPTAPTTETPPRTIALKNIADRLPLLTRGWLAKDVLATDVALVTATNLPAASYSLQVNKNLTSATFADVPDEQMGRQGMKLLRSTFDSAVPFTGDNIAWKLMISSTDPVVVLERMFFVIRYTLR